MADHPQRTEDHPLSETQSNTEEHKVATAIAAVTDPKFPLPTLNSHSSPLRYVLSFITLALLIGSGIAGAWYLDMEILRSSQPVVILGCAFAGILGALFFTGTVWIDWFGLVFHYWWLSMPVGGLAGLALVLNQQSSAEIREVS